jgi:hypothetical protein
VRVSPPPPAPPPPSPPSPLNSLSPPTSPPGPPDAVVVEAIEYDGLDYAAGPGGVRRFRVLWFLEYLGFRVEGFQGFRVLGFRPGPPDAVLVEAIEYDGLDYRGRPGRGEAV